METLEDKRPLAADLIVEVINGDLVITGDAGDNRFYIQSGSPEGEQYEFGNLGDFTDTINGEHFDSSDHYFSGVTGDIIINLGAGDDWINIMGTNNVTVLNMPRDLRIDMGAGDDRLAFGMGPGPLFDGDIHNASFPLNIARDMAINMGAGFDQTWIANTTVGRDITHTDPEGDAFLQFVPKIDFDSDGLDTNAGRDFSIVTGGGGDIVYLNSISNGRNLIVSLGAGDDYVGVLGANVGGSTLVDLGSGNDTTDLQDGNLGRSLTVLGSGSNAIFIADLVTANSISVLTGRGSDQIGIGGVQTGTVIITTGAEADELFLLDCAFDNLLLTLGGGNDTLNIGSTTVNGLALLLGGGGFDTIVNLGDNQFGLALALAFESWISES